MQRSFPCGDLPPTSFSASAPQVTPLERDLQKSVQHCLGKIHGLYFVNLSDRGTFIAVLLPWSFLLLFSSLHYTALQQ